MVDPSGGAHQPVGSLRRARQLFEEELTRLDVTLDGRAALDGLLDEMTSQFGISRHSLVKNYLHEGTVREMAKRAATEATGWDASLHTARQLVAREHPESAGWPALVTNYLIDHYALRSGAEMLARALLGEATEVDDLGLFRFGYRLSDRIGRAIGCAADGTVAVVSVQHRSLVRQGVPLVADPRWGRPQFEWAYELMLSAYRHRTGNGCDRLIWAWADTALAAAAHFPELTGAGAGQILAGIGGPDAVAVVARVPAARCLFSSHMVWDGLVLRGRYLPTDIGDALCFHAAHGSTVMDHHAESVVDDAIVESWVERFFWAPADRSHDVRLQVCLDRIYPEEIVEVIDIGRGGAVPTPWMIDLGVGAYPIASPPQRNRS